MTVQIAETKEDIEHLESISNALDIARQESDLADIKRELTEYGYIRKHSNSKRGAKHSEKSKPMHFISSDGFDMYVGKNNYQNDELTFHLATEMTGGSMPKQVRFSCHRQNGRQKNCLIRLSRRQHA